MMKRNRVSFFYLMITQVIIGCSNKSFEVFEINGFVKHEFVKYERPYYVLPQKYIDANNKSYDFDFSLVSGLDYIVRRCGDSLMYKKLLPYFNGKSNYMLRHKIKYGNEDIKEFRNKETPFQKGIHFGGDTYLNSENLRDSSIYIYYHIKGLGFASYKDCYREDQVYSKYGLKKYLKVFKKDIPLIKKRKRPSISIVRIDTTYSLNQEEMYKFNMKPIVLDSINLWDTYMHNSARKELHKKVMKSRELQQKKRFRPH